jgi:hypothetical protein
VLGRAVRINGHDFTVIGVAPASFTGMNQYVRSDFFVPLMMSARLLADPKTASLQARDARNLTLKGRLSAGVSQAQAQTELASIAANLAREHPDTNRNRGLVVRTELQARMSQSPPDAMLIAMLSTLAFAVLFVACANVAGLLTSRAPVRAREMALRLAIGAKRGRLVAQLVTESLLISVLGGVLGLGIGYAGMTLFRQIQLPTDLPITLSFQLDQRALIFSLIVAVTSAVLFGLVPADPGHAHGSHRGDEGRRRRGAQRAAAETRGPRRRSGGVSVVLLVVAMFMYRGFREQIVSGPASHRSPADDGIRHDARALLGPQSAQFFQLAERARAPGRHQRHDDDGHPDVDRLAGFRRLRLRAFSSPRAGERHGALIGSRRALLRDAGDSARAGPQLHRRRRFRRRAWAS